MNEFKAAPVLYCQKLLPAANIRALVTNCEQANAATGPQGVANNLAMAQAVAKELGIDVSQVLTASTGVIGKQMEIEKIVAAVPEMVERATDVAESFALAILTTDLVPKTVTTTCGFVAGFSAYHRHLQRLGHDSSQYGDHAGISTHRPQADT